MQKETNGSTKNLLERLNKKAARQGRRSTRIKVYGCQARHLKNLGYTVDDSAVNAPPDSIVWASVSWNNPAMDTEARKTFDLAEEYHQKKSTDKYVACKRRARQSHKKALQNKALLDMVGGEENPEEVVDEDETSEDHDGEA